MFKKDKQQKLNITEEQRKKCHAIIHSASVAAGGVGAAGAQIPVADNAVLLPIQVGMIIGLGNVFNLEITKTVANGILKSAAASIVGRTASQLLVGWIPIAGNAINSATAASITEAIGWIAVKEFSEKSYKYISYTDPEDQSIPSEDEKFRKEFDWSAESKKASKYSADTSSSPHSTASTIESDSEAHTQNRFSHQS